MNEVMEDDLDSIFGGHDAETRAVAQEMTTQQPVQVYPLALADGTIAAPSTPPILQRQVGGLPVWGWALLACGAGIGGYYWYTNREVKKNDGGDDRERDRGTGDAGESDAEPGGWEPSRSRLGDQLRRVFSKSNIDASKVTVYTDADLALKARLPRDRISPLVTVVSRATLPVKEMEKLARRDGLKVISHPGGIIGFYPAESGKRGRIWEEYVDALRDEGQTV